MQDADFAAAPWRTVTDAQLAPAAGVPTMLSPEEQRLYYWLAREGAGGTGAVADLGSFVGGSTARLALGLADGGRADRIEVFDRFTADPRVKARHLYPAGVAPFEGTDILPLSQRLLAPWAGRIRWHRGEITDLGWPQDAGAIRLLVLDICKTPASCDHVARTFLPRLREGAMVNQQDMLQWDQPWTAVQTLLLTDWLEPVARVDSSLLLRCVRVPAAADLAAARVTGLTDADLIEGLAEAKARFGAFGGADEYDRMIAAVRANPGVRLPWKMAVRPPRR